VTTTVPASSGMAARLPLREKSRLAREVIALYVATRILLRRRRLPHVVAELRGEPARRPDAGADEATVAIGLRLGRIVNRTLGVLPFDSRCLVRSLVLIALLARRNVYASLVIGVRSEPGFDAHAWVEYEGRPLTPDSHAFARLIEL
jgi:hypothetical protein